MKYTGLSYRALLLLFPAAYMAFLASQGLSLYDQRSWVNLGLRFLIMDLFPLLWAAAWFWDKLEGWPDFLQNLSVNAREKPYPLAAPVLAIILFVLESGRALLEPSSVGPTPLGQVLWMQAATALMAAIVLAYGSKVGAGKVSTARFGKTFAMLLTGIGLAYFLATHCDISRLLIGLGLAGMGIQWSLRALGKKPRP